VHLGGEHDLVPAGEVVQRARPVISSLVPALYTLAVSKKLIPASTARQKNGLASPSPSD
jgi:hypothetical protein